MGKKKDKRKQKKIEKEDRKRGRAYLKQGTPGTTSLGSIDLLHKIWGQIPPSQVQQEGSKFSRYTWEFVPGEEPLWPPPRPEPDSMKALVPYGYTFCDEDTKEPYIEWI